MNPLDEALLLTLGADLAQIHPAANRALAWCAVQGVPADSLARIELPLVEALNNAIEHGCSQSPDAVARLTVRVLPDAVVAEIADPGHFVPPATWADLPEDPLAEGGRGGFIINSSTDSWVHANSPSGHTLTLRWHGHPLAGRGLLAAAESETSLDRLTADLANSFETLLGLTHFAGLLATSATFAQLLDKVQERLRSMVVHDHLVIRFIEEDHLSLHSVGTAAPIPDRLPLDRSSSEGTCALDRRPFVGQSAKLPAGDPLATCAEKLCLMPVEFGGQTLGTLAVTRADPAPAFTGGEVELLQAVADFIGIARATENLWQERTKRLGLEQEIQVAANIQRSLLPATFPVGTRWHIHGACRPAREVGGDYFDVVALPDGGALLLIADVMGKGVPASLLAAMLRSSLRALSAVETAPDRILTGINRQLFPDLVGLGMFITAVLVLLPADPANPVCFANAGHCAPAVLRADGSVHEAPDGDVPLGVLPDTLYHAHPLPVGLRDRLFLYTDGCYELNASDQQMLGPDRFLRLAAERRALPPSAFVAALLDPVALQLDPAAINDDRTLLVASPTT